MNPANYSLISFPLLGLELNPGRSFSIGPLEIHYYGLVIALALGAFFALRGGDKPAEWTCCLAPSGSSLLAMGRGSCPRYRVGNMGLSLTSGWGRSSARTAGSG